ncbi:esterase/lipase family protein [Baaleninema simplex]|uniref:esterase/lipase family protein n=1 Tax=Baaleninema simplex TaxID=2862350 RepID=UPI0003488BF7|nr:hypothetical protein [Baaleninema simplex]
MPRPTVILPGYFASADDYHPLAEQLRGLGIPTTVVPLRKSSWIPTLGGRSIVPILREIDRAVCQAIETHSASEVDLVGHSAGGWIGRIYLGEKPYCIHGDVTENTPGLWNARSRVRSLVCLGTPHTSQEYWTRRNLDFVNENYPGAFYPDVRYLCVAGKSVFGRRRLGGGQWLAYNSYKLTCGEANTWGDGITPIAAAHLAGAENLTLEDVWHSPRSPGRWYGSEDIVPQWSSFLFD